MAKFSPLPKFKTGDIVKLKSSLIGVYKDQYLCNQAPFKVVGADVAMNGFGGTSLVFRLINLDNSKININIIDIIGGAKITSQKRDFIIVHESDIVYHKPMIKPKYLK